MEKKEKTIKSRRKYNTFSEEFREETVELADRVGNNVSELKQPFFILKSDLITMKEKDED